MIRKRLNEVVEIRYLSGHRYYIRFDDGLEGDLDFSSYIGRADLSFFSQASIERRHDILAQRGGHSARDAV